MNVIKTRSSSEVRPDVGGHSGDEAHELVALGDPDPGVPLLQVAGGLQGPGQELWAVVKPGICLVIMMTHI